MAYAPIGAKGIYIHLAAMLKEKTPNTRREIREKPR